MSTERLLDITNRIQQLQAMEGTIDKESFHDTLEGLEGEFEDKVARCIKMRDSYERELVRMKEILRAYERKMGRVLTTIEHLESYVQGEMMATKIRKVETPEVTVALRDYPAVDIINVDDVPSQLMRTKPPKTTTYEPAPDKKAILTQLKAGETVPGCVLNPNTKMQVTYPTAVAIQQAEEPDNGGT